MTAEKLTVTRLRKRLYYSKTTGLFSWLVRSSSRTDIGDIAGCGNTTDRYIYITVDGVRYSAHRLAWFYVYGVWPTHEIDHKNEIRHDNRWSNLRPATRGENEQNQSVAQRNSKSGVLGVCWDNSRKKWRAFVKLGGKQIHHSYHISLDDAVAARAKAKAKYHTFVGVPS